MLVSTLTKQNQSITINQQNHTDSLESISLNTEQLSHPPKKIKQTKNTKAKECHWTI